MALNVSLLGVGADGHVVGDGLKSTRHDLEVEDRVGWRDRASGGNYRMRTDTTFDVVVAVEMRAFNTNARFDWETRGGVDSRRRKK